MFGNIKTTMESLIQQIVRHEMMVIHLTQSLYYIFQRSSVARECGPKETIVEMVEYEIFGKPNQSGGSRHSKENVYSPKGGLLILDTVLIVVRVLKISRV